MTGLTCKVEPLTPTIGAIVHDLDLRDVVQDDQLFAVVHDHWIRHQVLFFRDQALSATEQLALGERFGPLHIHPAAPYVDDNPALMQIHADADSQRNNGEVWHSDVSADAEPPMASILKIHQLPASGGDTLWASMYAVYESLSEEVQEWLLDLTATHHMSYTGFTVITNRSVSRRWLCTRSSERIRSRASVRCSSTGGSREGSMNSVLPRVMWCWRCCLTR